MLKKYYKYIQLIISKNLYNLLGILFGIISIIVTLYEVPSAPIAVIILFFVAILVLRVWKDAKYNYDILKEKHIPIIILAGRNDDEYKSMMSDVLETMTKYKFDKQSFDSDFNIDQEDYINRRTEDLSENSHDWENIVHVFENKIIHLSKELKGRKVFHIFLNCPAPLAMGMGAVLGTKFEIVLHHFQQGCGENKYFPVIDFYSLGKTNPDGVHILKSRVKQAQYITIKKPEKFSSIALISIWIAGHDPRGDLEKIAIERGLQAIHITSNTPGTFSIASDWLKISREVSTYLMDLSANKDIKSVELYLSIPIVMAFAVGMALGTQSPIILNSWFPKSKKYYPVIELNRLRQPRL